MKTAEQILDEHWPGGQAWSGNLKNKVLAAMTAYLTERGKTREQILNKHCDSLSAWSENRKKAVLAAMDAYLVQHNLLAEKQGPADGVDSFNMEDFLKICKERPGEEKKLAAEGFMKISGEAFLQMWFMLGCEDEMCAILDHESGRYFLSFVPEKCIPFYLRKSVIEWDVIKREWDEQVQKMGGNFTDDQKYEWFKTRISKMVLLPPKINKEQNNGTPT